MMLLTTLVPVIFLLAVIYFTLLRKILEKYVWLSYGVVLLLTILYFSIGGIHFAYMAIENLALGFFLVWLHYRFWNRPVIEIRNI